MTDLTLEELARGPALRWGIAGPGVIAADFAAALQRFTGQHLLAVGSRSAARAQAFADRFDVPRVHDSYDALVTDPQVDVVYVATTNDTHVSLALQAIAAGKAVLVEKPLATDAAGAAQVARAAGRAGVFAAEAMWTHYLPHVRAMHDLVAGGVLGEPNWVDARAGGPASPEEASRLWDPDRGGGSLLDIGVYAISLAQAFLGAPDRVEAVGTLSTQGVDTHVALSLGWSSGAAATLGSTIVADMPNTAVIAGPRGHLAVQAPFLGPTSFTVHPRGAESWRWEGPPALHWRDGLCLQAVAVARYVSEGRIDSPVHRLADAVAVLETIDRARAQLAGSAGRMRLA